jgi:hypothetical protein
MKIKSILLALLLGITLFSCDDNKTRNKPYSVSQLDALIRDLGKEKTFSIILNDMDMDDNGAYKHQYKIILQRNNLPKDSLTDWKPVTPKFFEEQEKNMGMEIASKDSTGNVSKKASPAGYNNYVGNKQYGNWQTDNTGNSYWAFYGQYMFMQQMFGLNRPIYSTEYHTYTHDYRNTNRSYYGSGRTNYGTYGDNTNYSKSNYRTKVDNIKRSDRNRSNNSNSSWGSNSNKPSSSTNKPSSYSYDDTRKTSTSNSLRNNSTSRPSSSSRSIFNSGSSNRRSSGYSSSRSSRRK